MNGRLTNYLGNHCDLQWAETFGVLYKRWFLANFASQNRLFRVLRLKLPTQDLVSWLSIVAVAFLHNIWGTSFLMPVLEHVVCYSELYSYRIWKFWFFSLLLKPVQTNKASSDNAILTKRDSMSHTHALCFGSHLLSIPGHKLSHQKSAIFVHMHIP